MTGMRDFEYQEMQDVAPEEFVIPAATIRPLETDDVHGTFVVEPLERGYGTTLGTWFLDGATPLEVACVTDGPEGLEVDEHAIVVARYTSGLCKFETRWGTFTDPWTHQPQPKCGFVIVGSDGTISSYDYEETVRVQTRQEPQGLVLAVDEPVAPMQNPVQYVLHCIETGAPIEGPLDPKLSRVGQRIVDSAMQSARDGRSVDLCG